jgi:exonuclease SbcD
MGMIRILFLADTHLGFDYPFRPRVERRRRGPDFFHNYDLALQPAYRGEVDLVVHGGDIFYRSKVPARLVDMAFAPLKRVADMGVPVYVVPGNHERSSIPYYILAAHPNIFVFDQPKCFVMENNGIKISLAGFPFLRHGIRKRFPEILERTGWQKTQADVHVLCMHQSVDGATMGPGNFMFRGGDDVIDLHDIPSGFAAVLTGHMHRYQVLQKDLKGRPLPAPVLYAGSIERTSFAEKDEAKGYLVVGVEGSKRASWQFHELPTRPMVSLEVDVTGMTHAALMGWLRTNIKKLSEDSIVKVVVLGKMKDEVSSLLQVKLLRSFVPTQMDIVYIITQFGNKNGPTDHD